MMTEVTLEWNFSCLKYFNSIHSCLSDNQKEMKEGERKSRRTKIEKFCPQFLRCRGKERKKTVMRFLSLSLSLPQETDLLSKELYCTSLLYFLFFLIFSFGSLLVHLLVDRREETSSDPSFPDDREEGY